MHSGRNQLNFPKSTEKSCNLLKKFSQEIDLLEFNFPQKPELPECSTKKKKLTLRQKLYGEKEKCFPANCEQWLNCSTKANASTNHTPELDDDLTDDIDFEELKELEQINYILQNPNTIFRVPDLPNNSNDLSSKENTTDLSDVSKKVHCTTSNKDFDMEPLDDVDFEQLTCLEKRFSGNLKENKRHHERKCQTQLQLNPLRPSNTDKSVKSCPPPPIVKPSLTTTENTSTNPMDFLQLTYSKTSSISTQKMFTQLSLATDLDNVLEFTQITKSPNKMLEFCLTTQNLPKDNINERESSTTKINSSSKSSSSVSSILRFNKSTADTSLVPTSVKQLHGVIKEQYSDFSFMYALSAQLCQDRIPMDCFVTLKMALLLSLVSIGSNPDRPPVPIIAIGSDTYMTNYLMTNVGQMASRFVGPTEDTKPPSSNGYRNHNWIEADPILLAQGGVYYVGDWSRLKLARSERLYKDLESCTVTVEKSSHTYPLQTAIWAHWRSVKNTSKDEQMFNKFIKIFGIPIYVAEDNHQTLVSYTLEQASIRVFESTVDHLSISSEDMRNFLTHVSERSVDVAQEAANLLQKYFVASRIARPDCLTKQAFITLKQFAESFAKLSLRHEVLAIDAISAIILCEHSIENIFGISENSPPHFGSVPFVGAVDEYLLEFEKWLDFFITKYYKE